MKVHRLWALLRSHRRSLAVGLGLGLAANAAGLAAPLVTKWVLDSLADDRGIRGPVLTLLALVLGGAVVSLAQWLLFGRLGERVVREARMTVAERILRSRVGPVTAISPGEVVTRVTSDTGLLHGASSGLVGLINAVIGLAGTLVLMGVLDLPLLGTTIVAVIIVAVVMGLLLPRIAEAETRAQAAVSDIGATIEGAVRAIRTVKASNAEQRVIDRVADQAATSERHAVHAAETSAWVWTVSWTGVQLAVLAILGIGAWRVDQGAMAVTTLIAFLLYAFQLMGPITELTQHLTGLQSGIAAATRIAELDRFTPEPAVAGAPAALDLAGPVLELRGVSARYALDGPEAVSAVDLRIPRRGHVALVGPSGAGKTTVLSLLLRFVEPSTGELRLDGQPYSAWSAADVRRRLGYVEQETPLVPGSIRDNLAFTHPDADEAELRRALRLVRLEEVVDALPEGLDTSLQSGQLSGGQRQRLAMARAVLRTPEVLLLDEATAQVDGVTERALQECIADVAGRAAVVTVAHRLSTVLDADQIVVMDDGGIRAAGTHAELVASDELYRDLVEALRIRATEATDDAA